MFDPPRSSFRFLRFSGCALAKAQFSLSLSLSLSLSAFCHVSWSFVLSIKLLREKEEEDDRDMYTGILVWASAPVPVHVAERAPVGDQDVDLRSRWHSMLENCGLKLARDRRFVKCGRRLQHMSRLGVFRCQCGKGNGRLPQADNKTVSKMKLTNWVNQSKNKKGLSSNGRDLREKFNVSQANDFQFRLDCTGRTCITPINHDAILIWSRFTHVSIPPLFLVASCLLSQDRNQVGALICRFQPQNGYL